MWPGINDLEKNLPTCRHVAIDYGHAHKDCLEHIFLAQLGVWTNLIKHKPAAKLTIDRKFQAIFSQLRATRLDV